MANPGQVPFDVGATRTRLRTQANKTYGGLTERLEQANVRRGFGSAGVTGSQRRQVEIARAGQFGDIEAQLQEYMNNIMLSEKARTESLAFNFGRPQGQNNTSFSNAPVGAAIGDATGDIGFLMMLSKLFKQGGAGGGQSNPAGWYGG